MKKEWTVRDGLVGTHHLNREGKSVDFRPAKIVAGPDFINVEPPKGQDEIRCVGLTPTRVIKEVAAIDYPHKGMQRIRKIFFAEFMGIEITATHEWAGYEWYDPIAEQAAHEASAARQAAEADRIEDDRNFLRNFPKENFAGKVTLGEVAKLRAGKNVVDDICRRILTEVCKEELGREPYGNLTYSEVDRRRRSGELEEIKNLILAEEARQREERKRTWLARQG